MTNADNETPDTKQADNSLEQLASIKSGLDSKLSEVQEQLKAMNSSFAEAISKVAPASPAPTDEDIDMFDTKRLKAKILDEATTMSRDLIQEERRKNNAIFQLAQDYPEIQTDRELQQAILAAQKTLPKSMQDTADGYEMAVLKAVAKQGIIPKSKRKSEDVDVDVSVGARSASMRGNRGSSKKVSDKTLIIAQLLGRDVNDKDVLKGLEEATNRDSYGRFR